MNFVKKLLCFGLIVFFVSCERNKKVTSFLKPFTELNYEVADLYTFNELSFLFIIDTSGSMSQWQKTMSENLSFMENIFLNYPYYNYNFAFTTMSARKYFYTKDLIYSTKTESYCPNINDLTVNNGMGSYLSYRPYTHVDFNVKDLICPISENITQIQGDKSEEPYFESLFLIMEEADDKFKSRFFGKNFLVILFLSDVSGIHDRNFKMIDIQNLSQANEVGEAAAKFYFNKLLFFKGDANIRSYASVMLPGDHYRGCKVDDSFGVNEHYAYPFHLYKFIEKTGGLKTSLCDPLWGHNLKDIYKDLSHAFFKKSIILNEVPEVDTIEVYFNEKKVFKDHVTGWFFDPEKVAISFGYRFNTLLYQKSSKWDTEKDIIKVRYKPVNSDLLKEGINDF